MTGAVGVAEVDEGGVDQHVLLALLQQVLEVAEVAETATYPIPGSVGKYKRGKRKVREKYSCESQTSQHCGLIIREWGDGI